MLPAVWQHFQESSAQSKDFLVLCGRLCLAEKIWGFIAEYVQQSYMGVKLGYTIVCKNPKKWLKWECDAFLQNVAWCYIGIAVRGDFMSLIGSVRYNAIQHNITLLSCLPQWCSVMTESWMNLTCSCNTESHWTGEVEMKRKEERRREGGKDDMQSGESLTDVAQGCVLRVVENKRAGGGWWWLRKREG